MSFSGVLSGIVLCCIGFAAIAASLLQDFPNIIFILGGLVCLGTGVYMIVNTKKEDEVEQIRKK